MKRFPLVRMWLRLTQTWDKLFAFMDEQAAQAQRRLRELVGGGGPQTTRRGPLRVQLGLERLETRVVMTAAYYSNSAALAANYVPSGGIASSGGNVWLTLDGSSGNKNAVVEYNLGTHSFTTPIAISSFGVTGGAGDDIITGPAGALWFTDNVDDAVGKLVGSTATTYSLGDTASALTVGSDGNVWFIYGTSVSGGVGKVTSSGTITTYSLATSGVSALTDLTAGSDGDLWFSYYGGVGKFSPSAPTTVTTYALNDGGHGNLVAAALDGRVWFEDTVGSVYDFGWITTAGVNFEYVANPGGTASALTADASGNVWFGGTNEVGMIAPNGSVSAFQDPVYGSVGVITGTGGDTNAWFVTFNGTSYSLNSLPEAFGATAYNAFGGEPLTSPQLSGNLSDAIDLYIDDSIAPTALVYNSNTTNVQPVVMVNQGTSTGSATVSGIQTTLTWSSNSPQSVVSVNTSADPANDTYLLGSQVASSGGSTGLATWTLDANVTITSGTFTYDVNNEIYSSTAVVNNQSSPFGDGWSLAGLYYIVNTINNGELLVSGNGQTQYFGQAPASGVMLTTPNNAYVGTLQEETAGSTGGFIYTTPDQEKYYFNGTLVSGMALLTGIVSPAGPITTLSYDSSNNYRLSEIYTPAGGIATFAYSNNSNTKLSSIQLPGGRTFSFATDGSANVTSVTDPTSAQRNFAYSSHLLTSDSIGTMTATLSYASATSLLTQISFGSGVTQTVNSLAAQSLASSTGASVSTGVYSYPIAGIDTPAATDIDQSPAGADDMLGGDIGTIGAPGTYTYDSTGQVGSLAMADGSTQDWSRNYAGQVTVYADGLGNVTTYTYASPGGNLLEVSTPTGTTSYLYDASNNMTQMTDPRGKVTDYSYYSTDLLKTTTDPLGNVTTNTYDGHGNLTETIDANGNATSYLYDSHNRATMTIYGINSTNPTGLSRTSELYDAAGDVTASFDGNGHETQYQYDGDSRLTVTIDALGNRTTLTVNTAGQTTEATDADSNSTSYLYDAEGRLTMTIAGISSGTPSGMSTTSMVYDGHGNVVESFDANGNATSFLYDANDRLTLTVAGINGVSTMGLTRTSEMYDKAGNVTASFDGDGNETKYEYDGSNRLTVTVDALGNRNTLTLDGAGETVEMTDANSNSTSYLYDGDGRLTMTIAGISSGTPSGTSKTSMTYDNVGNVTASFDGNGNETQYQYDAQNRLTVTLAGIAPGTTTWLSRTSQLYDGANNVTASFDGDGHETQYQYDADERLTVTIDALSGRTTLSLDGVGNTTEMTDANSNSTSYLYDALERQTMTIAGISTATPSGISKTSQMYDAANNVTASFDGDGHETKYQYDAESRLTVTIDAASNSTTVSLDGAGNTVKVTDGNSDSTSYLYDADNRLTLTLAGIAPGTTVWPSATSQMYDNVGNVTASFDGDGHETKYQYDAENRLTVTIDALSERTTLTLDGNGNTTGMTDGDGHGTGYLYDAANRLTGTTDGFGTLTAMTVDGAGNTTMMTDPSGNSTSYLYDADNRLTMTIAGISSGTPSGLSRTSQMYDKVGNVTAAFDGDGHETQYQFDAENRLTVTVYADSTRTTQLYDGAGNMTYVKDADNNITTFAYDGDNRQVSATNPNSYHATYAYDGVGNLTLSIDADGRAITYQYDALDRPTGQTWYTGSVLTSGNITQTLAATYDGAGNQLTASDGAGAYTMTYDALNRVSVAQDVGGLALTFSYDAAGNRTQVSYEGGGAINGPTIETSTFDADNRLTEREEAVMTWMGGWEAELEVTLSYQANGLLASVNRYGVADFTPYQNYDVPVYAGGTAYHYDAADRMTSLAAVNQGGGNNGNYAYSYDGGGLLTGQVFSDPAGNVTTFAYTYNSTNELTSGAAITYAYDATGNRTTVIDDSAGGAAVTSTYSTATGNEIGTDGTWNYTYDHEGNITKKVNIADTDAWTYQYDNDNHMIQAEEWTKDPALGGTSIQTVTYEYDYYGNCVVADGTQYYYDGWNPALKDATGNAKWVAWGELAGGSFNQYMHGDQVGQLFSQVNDGTPTSPWYLQDYQNSVVGTTDFYGNIQSWTIYDAYGNVWGAEGTAPPTEWGYQGERYDSATGLYEMGARYYDPTVGKWTTQDPMSFAAGDSNLYRYVNNSPTNWTDPSGTLDTTTGLV